MADSVPFDFTEADIEWRRFRDLEGVYYHLLGVDVEHQTVDWLMKFDPGRTGVIHRHTGPTKTFVLSGEHHVFRPDGEGGTDIEKRTAGVRAPSHGDDVHNEGGGADGAVIYLSMTGKDGTVYDILDDEFNLERAISIDDFKRGLDKRLAAQGG